MNLEMSTSDMLKYHEILQKKAEVARKTGKQTMLDAVLKRIDAIEIIIDAAFMYTMKESAPQIAQLIDVKMIDIDALKFVLGPSKILALPMQGEINFNVVEEEETFSNTATLKGSLEQILSRNFTSRIPEAIAKYRELTGSKEPDAVVWIKIKESLDDHRLIPGWDRSITHKLINNGPIVAFHAIKKHVPDWSDLDVCIALDDATQRTVKRIPEKKESEKMNNRTFSIMNSFPKNIREYLDDEPTAQVIKSYIGLEDKTRMGQYMATLANVIAPSTRAKILTRKEYVEKGY